jgi:MFS family permease
VSRVDLRLQTLRDVCVRWLAPGEVAEQWNAWNLYREIAWFGVLSAVNATFISVFALRLGATDLLVGLLTSLPALVNVVFQIPAARLVEREADRKKVVLLSGFLMRLPALLISLVPLLPSQFQSSSVVYVTALGTIPAAVGTVSFTAMLADVVAPKDRPQVVSVRNALLSVATTVTVLVAGKALDLLPFPSSYQLIFALAFVASLISLYYLGRISIPETEKPHGRPSEGAQGLDPQRSVRMILAHPDYVRFTVGAFVYHWGLHFPIPLYSIYRVRTLQLSESWIGALAMLESAVTIIAYYGLGRLAQRRGSRPVLLLGLVLVCFYPIGMALSSSPWPLLCMSLVAGVAGPAFNLGLFNNLLDVVPNERRASYIALFNTLMNVSAFVSPLLGTTAAGVFGIRTALWVGGAARIGGLFAFVYLFPGLASAWQAFGHSRA